MKLLKLILCSLDYMFYRVAKAYLKRDGEIAITAYLTISLFLYGLIFSPILLIFINIFGRPFIHEKIDEMKGIMIIMALIVLGLTFLIYRNKFDKLDEIYKTEKEITKKLKGTLVVLVLLFPWLVLVIGSIILM